MQQAIAIIMAGGRGKRMDILCYVRPKPSLPFAGKYRVIDFSLSNCIHSRIKDVLVLSDYQRDQMAIYLNQWNLTNSNSINLHVREPNKGSYLGTVDAVYQNLDYIRGLNADRILILAGDHVYKMDYNPMFTFHQKMNADVTIGVIKVPIEEVYRFGTITLDDNKKIIKFAEKDKNSKSNIASMGIYIFNKEILFNKLQEDAIKPDSIHDFGYTIIPEMINNHRVYAYEYGSYWQDIGTTPIYYSANLQLARSKPPFSLTNSHSIITAQINLPAPRIIGEGSVHNSIISPGCVIKGQVKNSVLSPGVWIEEKALVKDSVIMANVYVGYHSLIDRCILDEEVNVGQFCYAGFGSSVISEDGDITILGKGASIPIHTTIGRNCKIMPYVNPTDFDSNYIPSCSVISPRVKSRTTVGTGNISTERQSAIYVVDSKSG